jgi:hypothetical protein
MGQDTKFTPGPWRVEQDTTLVWGNCNADDSSNYGMGYPIAECRITPANPLWAKGPDHNEGEANAHLISTAPELYEALIAARKHIVDGFRNICHDFPESRMAGVTQIDAALAKARGEQ